MFGYAAAETLLQVLTQCGDDLSRENIMRQAASLKNYQSAVTLPGIAESTNNRPNRLPSHRADAAGAVRRQRLAADRRRDRERVRGEPER